MQADIYSNQKIKSIPAFFVNHKTEWTFTLIFFCLSLIGIFRHEIWLDEAQHFLLARDSNSISNLIYNCRMEGHPLLWNLLLFFITRFSQDPLYMQMLHILISCCTVYLIAGTELKIMEKCCIIFSFFIFYEYNIISRNYGLATLMMCIIGIGYNRKSIAMIPLGIALAILAQTHLYGLLFSLAFIVALLFYDRNYLFQNKSGLIIAGLIYTLAFVIALISIIPPGHYTYLFMAYDDSDLLSSARILKTLSVCLKGIFYFPDFAGGSSGLENSNYFFEAGFSNWLLTGISIIAILIPLLLFRRNKFALTLFLCYFIIYSFCNYFLPLVSGVRYYGFFFVVFVICFLISRNTMRSGEKIAAGFIFTLQFFNGLFFYINDLQKEFSVSENATVYLETHYRDDVPVLILDKTIRPAISAYTKRNYFSIETGTQRSYCLWQNILSDDILKLKIDSLLHSAPEIIVLTGNTIPDYLDAASLELKKEFTHSMLKHETVKFYLYRGGEKQINLLSPQ